MDAVLARIIKELSCITFLSELCLGTIGDGQAFAGRELWLARARMLESKLLMYPGMLSRQRLRG